MSEPLRMETCLLCDAPHAPVTITLSHKAAHFLQGFMDHVNDVKMLPADPGAALETSAWMEEIAAMVRAALTATGEGQS